MLHLFCVGYERLTSLIIAHLLPRPTLAAAVVMRILDVFK